MSCQSRAIVLADRSCAGSLWSVCQLIFINTHTRFANRLCTCMTRGRLCIENNIYLNSLGGVSLSLYHRNILNSLCFLFFSRKRLVVMLESLSGV